MKSTSQLIASALFLGACVLLSGIADAGSDAVGGSMELTYTKQDALPVAESPDHLVLLGEVKGVNKSTGTQNYMDGAAVTNREIGQLFRGSGPHSGYITLAKGSDATVALWSGQVTTTPASDGKPLTRFEGTWKYVAGTGKYAGIQGSGEYHGHFTSAASYVVDWSGNYSVGQ